MRSWFLLLRSVVADPVISARAGEALREAALLWFVFANLDRLVSDRLTAAWAFSHMSASFVVWVFGVYIEKSLERRQR
ncbi:MAG: hypothetical protein M3Q69_06735 [Acidobacteriota bacterium]|nr:hypothetical protein [Acidobacteriota bacterium]